MKLSKLINEAWLSDENKEKFSYKQKQAFLEAIAKFNNFNKSIYRESSLEEVTKVIKELCFNAKDMTLGESGDWFDGVTVGRNMKHLNDSVKLFEKTAREISQLQQRLESSYEDIGSTLSKYYNINELDDIDDEEAAADFDDLEDKDIDNDGDSDDSDEYLHHKLGNVAKRT
jgi:hypothetical protein